MQLKKILVATDFSPAAELAVRRSVALAHRFDAELRLVHAVPPLTWLEGIFPSKKLWSEQVRSQAAAALKKQAVELASQGAIEVSTALFAGKASVAIDRAIEHFAPDLLVIGASGDGQTQRKHKHLGHTASKLIGATTTPLVLTRSSGERESEKVVGAIDLTPASLEVARGTKTLAGPGGAVFLHVFEAEFAPRLRKYGVKRKTLDLYAEDQQRSRERDLQKILNKSNVGNRVKKAVVRGDAVKTITAYVRKFRADTLVVGKHGRRKRDAAAPYGSVCYYLTHYSTTDVLVVP